MLKSETTFFRPHSLRNTLIGIASIALIDGSLSDANNTTDIGKVTNAYNTYSPHHNLAHHFEDANNGRMILTLASPNGTSVSNEPTSTTVLAQGTESGILEPCTLEPAGPATLPTMYDTRPDPSKYVDPEVLSLVRIVKILG